MCRPPLLVELLIELGAYSNPTVSGKLFLSCVSAASLSDEE